LQNKGKIARMELVPLRDGTWRSAHGDKLFFANESARLTVPPESKYSRSTPRRADIREGVNSFCSWAWSLSMHYRSAR
jgi:hypothetical protein